MLSEPPLARVVPALRAGCDAVTRLSRPLDVLALVADAPLECERRAERHPALRGPVLTALALGVREGLFEAGEPLSVTLDLVVEEGDRLGGLEEPEHEETQNRLVANGSIRRGVAQPPLGLGDPLLGDRVCLA